MVSECGTKTCYNSIYTKKHIFHSLILFLELIGAILHPYTGTHRSQQYVVCSTVYHILIACYIFATTDSVGYLKEKTNTRQNSAP
jgi:hypothetical protein